MEQVLVCSVKCLECSAACGRARPCVARRVVGVGVSAEPGMCCALGAEEYLVRASVKVAARGDGAAIPVPVPGRSFLAKIINNKSAN